MYQWYVSGSDCFALSVSLFLALLIVLGGWSKEPGSMLPRASICLSMMVSAHAWSMLDNANGSSGDSPAVRMRRQVLADLFDVAAKCAASSVAGGIVCAPTAVSASSATPGGSGVANLEVTDLANFPYRDDWTGSNLRLLSITDAASLATSSSADKTTVTQFEMGRWPDPILRRQAAPISSTFLGTDQLKVVGEALRKTAQAEGAVGLAAQQCGVDGRMLWINTSDTVKLSSSTNKRKMGRYKGVAQQYQVGEGAMMTSEPGGRQAEGLFLVNPRITWRSSEMNMLPWTETCLVLPPKFSATVLRDASITVEYETLEGETKSISLDGELARCVQHEMDHDRGILLVDHIDLGEMEGGESGTMATLERENHSLRMTLAYERYVSESTL